MTKESDQLRNCPFCGRKPKSHLGKKTYCQLHGEESQGWVISCCFVRIENDSKDRCFKIWNGEDEYVRFAGT